MLHVDAHPLLALGLVHATHPTALGAEASPAWLVALLAADAPSPFEPIDSLTRAAVRDLLRHAGYKPTGRGKPASEYLARAASEGSLRTINSAVDAANAVSLHSGLPLSVVDIERVREPLSVSVAKAGAAYVFNAAGQSIDIEGLLCLHDADGPCANAVKDSQRSKTRAETRRTLTVIWGARGLETRVHAARAWLEELLLRLGAELAPAHDTKLA